MIFLIEIKKRSKCTLFLVTHDWLPNITWLIRLTFLEMTYCLSFVEIQARRMDHSFQGEGLEEGRGVQDRLLAD